MRNYIARHTSISYIIIIIIMHYWQLFFICYQQQQLMIGNHNFSAEPNDFGSLSINSMWQVFIQEERTFIFRKNSLYFTYPQLQYKGRCQKKQRESVGIFPKSGTPPPPFGNVMFLREKNYGLFCILGPSCFMFGYTSNAARGKRLQGRSLFLN